MVTIKKAKEKDDLGLYRKSPCSHAKCGLLDLFLDHDVADQGDACLRQDGTLDRFLTPAFNRGSRLALDLVQTLFNDPFQVVGNEGIYLEKLRSAAGLDHLRMGDKHQILLINQNLLDSRPIALPGNDANIRLVGLYQLDRLLAVVAKQLHLHLRVKIKVNAQQL